MSPLSPVEIQAILISLKVAIVATLFSLPLAVAVAWILARKNFWGKSLLDALVHLPLVLPPVAVGYGLLLLLGRNGMIGKWLYENFNLSVAFTWQGAAIAASVMSFPLIVRALRLSIESIDPKLEIAARTLGATRFRSFRTITLPLMMPGLITGTVLGFARALGEFGATITFAGNISGLTQTLPTALYTALQMPGGDTQAIRIAIFSLIIAFIALIASEVLARRARGRIYGAGS
jgi:molybdate transport system permease protein